jgi:hypothetical protein
MLRSELAGQQDIRVPGPTIIGRITRTTAIIGSDEYYWHGISSLCFVESFQHRLHSDCAARQTTHDGLH